MPPGASAVEGAGTWRWTPTRGLPPTTVVSFVVGLGIGVALLTEIVAAHGPGAFIDGLAFKAIGGSFVDIATVWLMGVALPIMLVVTAMWVRPSTIGVGPLGVRVASPIRTLNVAWSSLRPGVARPSLGWTTFRASPTRGRQYVWFWCTVEQARVILSSEYAPRELFPPESWRDIGLTPPGASTRL
jgi:hypothetical protein